jgi:hypothetical protein
MNLSRPASSCKGRYPKRQTSGCYPAILARTLHPKRPKRRKRPRKPAAPPQARGIPLLLTLLVGRGPARGEVREGSALAAFRRSYTRACRAAFYRVGEGGA